MMLTEDIIREARSWIGTRFHHQGRVKKSELGKGGCDCIGLIIGVANELGITHEGNKLSAYDRTDYAKVPDGKRLKEVFCKYMREISVNESMPGDVLMFRFDKYPQHVGIIASIDDELSLVHCYMQARGVVEHRLDDGWRERIVAAFRFCDE